MRSIRNVLLVGASVLLAGSMGAQNPAHDPSDRLREVLPASVVDHVLAVIAAARSHGLPAAALENRALKFAAKGVDPREIERSVVAQAHRMQDVSDTIEHARGQKPSGDEVEAGAEAVRQGVDGSKVSELAKSAPSGRSLAVPLFVIGSLVDRGLPSDEALARVLARLTARASDQELEQLPGEVARTNGQTTGTANRPETPGSQGNGGNRQGPPATTPPASGPPAHVPVAGPPAGVPANGGKATRPTPPATPPVVPVSKRP